VTHLRKLMLEELQGPRTPGPRACEYRAELSTKWRFAANTVALHWGNTASRANQSERN
jgi:hypothetical protein